MRYSNFIRRGVFKNLEPISASYRIMRATQTSMYSYLVKHIYRLALVLIGALVVTYIFNNRFAKEIKRCRIDVDNPYLSPYLHASRNEDDFLALYKIMLISSAVDLILTKTQPTDIDGSIAYYARPYEVLANNVEVIQNWRKLIPLIFNSQTLCQVSDLLINYKPLTYYSSQTKIQPDKLLTNDILKKASGHYGRVTMNLPFSQISNTEPVLMSKLLLSSELMSNRQIIGGAITEEQLQRKVEGILTIIENNINQAVQKRKLVIPSQTIKTLTRIFAITMFQSLNESIEADILNYEAANIFNASLTNPITYQFIDHRSDIMYDFSRNLMKKLGTMHYLLKIFSKVENSQLVKTIGDIISQDLPRNNIGRVISNVRISGERMSKFESSLFTATMALNVDKNLVPDQFKSRRYLGELKVKLDGLNKLKNEFNTQIIIRNIIHLVVVSTVSSIACSMPNILMYVRSEHGKYLFLSVTHETWLGLSLLLMFINFNTMFGAMYLSFYLGNTPAILGYDLPHSKVIELFKPIIMPSTLDYTKRNYKKTLFVILICVLMIFFADEHQFFTLFYILTYLIYIVEYGSIILLSYVSLKNILPAPIFSKPAIYTATKRQIGLQAQIFNTSRTLPTYMCIFADNESVKYIAIDSWIATNNSWAYSLLQNTIFVAYFAVVLAFLKLKLWHLPGAPEEFVSIY